MNGFTPKCALITGASQGLGRALAEECASRGMNLLLVALPGSGLPEAGRAIARKCEVTVEWLEADLTDPATHDRILALIRSKDLKIDLLINDAGISTIGQFADSGFENHEATIELNVLALVRLTHLLVPELAGRRGARIMNVGSLGAYFPMPYLPVYSATKSFVVTFSLALREELAGSIGVSVLCPNTIRTPGPVADYIDRLGPHCRLACLTPEQVARGAMKGLLRNKAIIVPGRINRFLHALSNLAPRGLVVRVIRRYWGEYGAMMGMLKPGTASRSESGVKIAG